MLLEESIVSFKGRPLFQRAKIKTPFTAAGQMDDMACFFYLIRGTYEVIESRGAIKVGANEALVKKCGNYVAHLHEGDWECITILFYPDILHEIYKFEVPSFLSKSEPLLPPKKMIANELLDKFIHNLFIYFDNPELMDEELALLKLKELILILLKSEQYASVNSFLGDLFTPDKLHFTSAIENNIFSNLNLQELAFVCHKSLSSFKREFKKIYNDTPARYIKNRRLDYAAQLLCSTENSVSAIAFEVGFQDITTFSASFREKFDLSPSHYRMSQTSK
ncbi:MAG: helix-turn-helix transcriptional regulator [Roseivirga sp.]|nr:helix-turn-helix transcriptional regulator [Roseivirga sp.]